MAHSYNDNRDMKEYVIQERVYIQKYIDPFQLTIALAPSMGLQNETIEKICDLQFVKGSANARELFLNCILEHEIEDDLNNKRWFNCFLSALEMTNYVNLHQHMLFAMLGNNLKSGDKLRKENDEAIEKVSEELIKLIINPSLSEFINVSQLILDLKALQIDSDIPLVNNHLENLICESSSTHTSDERMSFLLRRIAKQNKNWLSYLLLAIKMQRVDILKKIDSRFIQANNIDEMNERILNFVRHQKRELTDDEMNMELKKKNLELERMDFNIDAIDLNFVNQPQTQDVQSYNISEDFNNHKNYKKLKLEENDQVSSSSYGEKELNCPVSDRKSFITDTTDNNIPLEEQNREVPSRETIIPKELFLRDYQAELAKESLEKANCLIIAPTGSGKTHVSMQIVKEHLDEDPEDHRVLFFVPTVALVDQQAKQFQTYCNEYANKTARLHGELTERVSLKNLIAKNNIIVLTPQILVDSIIKKELNYLSESFSLLIFDECHHAMKGHPYAQIMDAYHYEKENKQKEFLDSAEITAKLNLPQIIGLTASVKLENPRSLQDAENSVVKLCSFLDCECISIVKDNVDELEKYSNRPDEEIMEVEPRNNDEFSEIISKIMSQIEMKLIDKKKSLSDFQTKKKLETIADPPTDKDSIRYKAWLSQMTRPFAQITDQNARRLFNAFKQHLIIYNEALLINADCRTFDAMEYIKKEMKMDERPMNDNEKFLLNLYKDEMENLNTLVRNIGEKVDNPKLKKLQEILIECCKDNMNSRAIIFVKTLNLVAAVLNWLRSNKFLTFLNASKLVGTRASHNRGGMTHANQEDVLQYFKDGKHRALIATSIGEEGLDISKCDLVITYEYVTDQKAMIQRRGRGRAENSRYILITQRGTGSADREKLNQIKESMMMKAIKKLNNMEKSEFQLLVAICQRKLAIDRHLRDASRKSALDSKVKNLQEYELRCYHCDQFACLSTDFRKVNETHYVVLSSQIQDNYIAKEHPNPNKHGEIEKIGKLYCIQCNYDWGIQIKNKNATFPALKLVSFILIQTNNDKRFHIKKWKDSPFHVKTMDSSELQMFVSSNLNNNNGNN